MLVCLSLHLYKLAFQAAALHNLPIRRENTELLNLSLHILAGTQVKQRRWLTAVLVLFQGNGMLTVVVLNRVFSFLPVGQGGGSYSHVQLYKATIELFAPAPPLWLPLVLSEVLLKVSHCWYLSPYVKHSGTQCRGGRARAGLARHSGLVLL